MANKINRYRSIAISGQACSGKSTICKFLEEKTGWKHVDVGGEFRKLAVNCHLEIEQFGSIPETSLRKVDQEIAQRIAKEFNKIWDGRLVCYLSQPIDSVFKVYCTAPMEVRAERLSLRERISIADASRKIMKRDLEEKEVFQSLYSLSDPYNSKWVDLQLNTVGSPVSLLDQVMKFLN